MKQAFYGVIIATIVMAFILFISAGTLRYWQAWIVLIIFFDISILITLYLLQHDPALLRRRLKAGPAAEKEPAQKKIMILFILSFILLLVISVLDYRFQWSTVPVLMSIIGNLIFILGFYMIWLVYKENTYAAATIEIASNQTVISTGPYHYVRHPMYTGVIVWLLGIPLALGSYWGLVIVLLILPILIWRLREEEEFLVQHLKGYAEYQQKVRWRLIPYIF